MIKQFSQNGPVGVLKLCCTIAADRIRALTARRPIEPTLNRCLSAWRPNPGRSSTYRRGKSVQTTGATSSLVMIGMEKPDPRIEAINRREKLKATIGNLTLVHYGINRSLQNGPFAEKRERLFAESNLHLNRRLMRAEFWDEAAIEERGSDLFGVARAIWRGP
jgi:hypothetical protein